MLPIVWLELREEVGAAIEAVNICIFTEIKVVTGIAARQLHTHHILIWGKMGIGLSVIDDLPTRLTCATTTAVPDVKCCWVFFSKCGLRTAYTAGNITEEDESRNE